MSFQQVGQKSYSVKSALGWETAHNKLALKRLHRQADKMASWRQSKITRKANPYKKKSLRISMINATSYKSAVRLHFKQTIITNQVERAIPLQAQYSYYGI